MTPQRTISELNDLISSREETLLLALEIGGIGIWEWNLDRTNTSGGRLFWDNRMHALFGTDAVSFGGNYEAFEECLSREDAKRVNEAVMASLTTNAPYNYLFRSQINGKLIRGKGKAFFNRTTGRPERMIGVCIEEFGPEIRCKEDCPYRHRIGSPEGPCDYK